MAYRTSVQKYGHSDRPKILTKCFTDNGTPQCIRTDNGVDGDCSDTEDDPEETNLRAEIGREIERLRDQTPTLTSPIGCSTELAINPSQSDHSGTPIHRQEVDDTTEPGEEPTGKLRPEQKVIIE